MNFSENFSVLDEGELLSGAEACKPYGFYIHLFYTYCLPLISIMGIVGNCLSFTVFMSPHLKMKSSSYYLAALAVADLGFLIVVTIVQCDFSGILEIYNRNGWCQFFVYVSSVCAFLSVWLIVAFTVERFIAVKYPLQKPHICTVRRARMIITTLFLFALTTQLYVFKVAGIIKVGDNNVCEMLPEYHEEMKIVNFVDTVFTLIIPLFLIIFLNTMIARCFISFRRKMLGKNIRKREENESTMVFQQLETQSDNPHERTTRSSFLSRDKKLRNTSENQFQIHIRNPESSLSLSNQQSITKMLLVIAGVFVALNLPSYLIRIWIFFAFTLFEKSLPELLWCTQQVTMLLYYTNFSINFVLYTMCGATFRRCLLKFFRLKERKKY